MTTRLTRRSAYAKPTAVQLEDKLSDDHKRIATCTVRLATLPLHLLANRLALQVMIESIKFGIRHFFDVFGDKVEGRNDDAHALDHACELESRRGRAEGMSFGVQNDTCPRLMRE